MICPPHPYVLRIPGASQGCTLLFTLTSIRVLSLSYVLQKLMFHHRGLTCKSLLSHRKCDIFPMQPPGGRYPHDQFKVKQLLGFRRNYVNCGGLSFLVFASSSCIWAGAALGNTCRVDSYCDVTLQLSAIWFMCSTEITVGCFCDARWVVARVMK